jgi:ribosomal protein L30E
MGKEKGAEGDMLANCKTRIIVVTENVPEEKKKKLMEHIAKNIKDYSAVLGCDLDVSGSP